MALKYAQTNTFYLAGSGVVTGATSLTLTNLTDIYGNVLTMNSFGAKGYGTLEPDTTNEEAFTWTGITSNANGTYTLTGISTCLAQSPYTETSGLIRNHSGGTKMVVTDNVAWWNTFGNKQNDEALVGRWTTPVTPVNSNDLVNKGYVDGVTVSGAPDASATVKGIARLSVSPNGIPTALTSISNASPAIFTLTAHGLTVNDSIVLTTTGTLPTGLSLSTTYYVISAGLTANAFEVSATLGGTAINTSSAGSGTHSFTKTTPISVGANDPQYVNYFAETGVANAYVITPTPSIGAYAIGQKFSFKAVNSNTTASTLNVNALGAIAIKKNGNIALVANDIIAGQIVYVEYDGTNFQMISTPSKTATATLDVGTGANQIVQLNGLSQLPPVSGANLTNLPLQAGLGVYNNLGTLTSGAISQATKDLMVIVILTPTSGIQAALGITDSNASPTTVITQINTNATGPIIQTIMFPVRKNDYWKVTYGGTMTAYTINLNNI